MIVKADARELPVADGVVQCVVTSPPYWGLRDYGHDGQIGLESTPEEYVENMRSVFRELWRVLKPDGVCWLNLGDSHASDIKGAGGGWENDPKNYANKAQKYGARKTNHGLKPKDLVGIPWRVAFALQADGWWLRSDVIWAKPNPMPESVRDRPTRAHEYIFLLTKSARYFYDADAIAECQSSESGGFNGSSGFKSGANGDRNDGGRSGVAATGLRNKRSVWTMVKKPYPEAHYATFPEELPETCIRAGSRVGDLVLDPFLGSGTVGRVAERLNRKWIGCDIGYQDLQKKRVVNVQRELMEAI